MAIQTRGANVLLLDSSYIRRKRVLLLDLAANQPDATDCSLCGVAHSRAWRLCSIARWMYIAVCVCGPREKREIDKECEGNQRKGEITQQLHDGASETPVVPWWAASGISRRSRPAGTNIAVTEAGTVGSQ